jgi:hypothetical protein
MKLSEVTVGYVQDYLRLDDPTFVESTEIAVMLDNAKAYILSYTGLTAEEADEHEDLTDALMLIISDSFDNRTMTFDKPVYSNKAVKQRLDLHSVNLL